MDGTRRRLLRRRRRLRRQVSIQFNNSNSNYSRDSSRSYSRDRLGFISLVVLVRFTEMMHCLLISCCRVSGKLFSRCCSACG